VVQHSTVAKVSANVLEENTVGTVTAAAAGVAATKEPFMDVNGFVVPITSLVDANSSNVYV